MKTLLRASLTAVLVPLLACSSTTEPLRGAGVTAVYRNERVAVTNRRDAPVYVFVIGRHAQAYTDWIPCTGPLCPSIESGTTREINPIISVQGETEVLVYWWQRTFGPEGGQPDSVRSLVVKLPRPL